MIALLNNLYIINPEKVKSQCIQLDIWDGIIRLIRPNSLIERFNFEKRKLQSKEILGLDDTLITLIYGLNFISNIIRNDAQIGDFLVD